MSDTALESLDIILFSTIIFGYHNVTHGTQKYTYVQHTTVVTFVKLGDLHEFARQIYRLRSDLHDLICSFLWDLQEFRFTSFQKGRDYHWFATFEKTRSTLICNKTVTFFKRKWKRFEATLHLLIIWKKHRERSQKRSLIFKRITLQAKRKNWKHC